MRRVGLHILRVVSGAAWLMLPAASLAAGHNAASLGDLRCEGVASPLAVAGPRPRLSWTYGGSVSDAGVQTEARVVVSRSEGAAKADRGDVWDSGWVPDQELALRYAGPALAPDTEYWWSVETRNGDGSLRSLARSPVASFRTADAQWTPQWIAAPWSTERDGAEEDGSRPMPVFRREFTLRAKPVVAMLRIAGLGQWQARIGRAGVMILVEPQGLHGAWTDYRKTITYDTVEVTPMLRAGRNVLAVMLGNGMYNVRRTPLPQVARGSRYTKFVGSFGVP